MSRLRRGRATVSSWTDQDTQSIDQSLMSDLEFSSRDTPGSRPQPRRSLGPQGGRRKGTACVRCRLQKIRCDDQTPSCGNCMKADHACLRARGNPELDSYVQELEGKIKQLERDLIHCKEQQGPLPRANGSQEISGHSISTPATHISGHLGDFTNTASPASTQIGPSEPLAHNVGLLSLANSREPKYLGPSSGVVFGRLVFAAAPAAQGLPAFRKHESRWQRPKPAQDQSVPEATDLLYFADAYFESYQTLYPFLDQTAVLATIGKISDNSELLETENILPMLEINTIAPIDYVQALLVSALGAKSLESRLRTHFNSEGLYCTVVKHLDGLPILETVGGVQILLLLTLASFSFENGYNAWYLLSTILASCLDLGLQRRSPQGAVQSPSVQALRSGIFWSAYSLDRTLCVVLGRPLTLRDEALDADFPDGTRSHDDNRNDNNRPVEALSYISSIATQMTPISITALAVEEEDSEREGPRKRAKTGSASPYVAACFSFRFDQIISEIKLMLHRVSQSSRRFPWPTEFSTWQTEIQSICEQLLGDLRMALGGHSGSARRQHLHDRTLQELELKFHQCIMLLHRPSPAIPHPGQGSLATCFASARSTIIIYASLHRFANLPNTWLVAHAIFVSGITMLFCVWTNRGIKESTTKDGFKKDCDACITLLKALGDTWSVAEDAGAKFERLVELTDRNWDKGNNRQSDDPTRRQGDTANSTGHNNHVFRTGTASEPVQANSCLTTTGHNAIPTVSENNLEDATGNSFSTDIDFSDLFLGELGDMSTWFDLSWLDEAEANPAYPSAPRLD